MKRCLVTISLSAILLGGCTDKKPAAQAPVLPRDTSIVAANAFTHLCIDSSSVRAFIDTAVKDSALATDILGFYNSRNFQYAWFDEEGLNESADAFWNVRRSTASAIKDSAAQEEDPGNGMDSLLTGDRGTYSVRDRDKIELMLTYQFIRYINPGAPGMISPEEVKWYIPPKKIDPVAALDTFLANNTRKWRPLGSSFNLLKEKLRLYSAILRRGGWPEVTQKKKDARRGMSSPEIQTLKERLKITGDFSPTSSGPVFDAALEQSIKRVQWEYGLSETGRIDKALISELNIPVKERIRQMLINLQRMKWMPDEGSDYILANIPEYRLRVYKNDTVALSMRIVVGKAAHHTVIFSDSLKYIVFSPYWNIPASIVRNEIVPAMERNKNYLDLHNMEITGRSGSLPIVRQRPGNANALGKVKFLFPNSYNIYFHDTPQKDLFDKQHRAFSHGCIRLQHPVALAKLLLAGDPKWTDKKINQAMHRSIEKWVTLERPIPVYIVYFTSWVDDDGSLHFAKDIYGHDRILADHLFKE